MHCGPPRLQIFAAVLLSSVTGVLNEVCSQTPVGTLTKAQTVAIPSTKSGEAGGKICLRSIKKPAYKSKQLRHYSCTTLVIAAQPILAPHVHLWSVFILYAASSLDTQNHLPNVV